MLSCLDTVKNALLTVSNNVGHYTAWDDTAPYIVWAEDSEVDSLEADDYKAGQTIEGSIDLFTRNEDDPLIESLPRALNSAGVGWNLSSVQYEDETKLIHYEWLFRVRQSYGKD